MNKADIIRMARMVGIDSVQQYDSDTPATVLIERFAALVASAEREACAKIGDYFHDDEANCGDLIRARGQV